MLTAGALGFLPDGFFGRQLLVTFSVGDCLLENIILTGRARGYCALGCESGRAEVFGWAMRWLGRHRMRSIVGREFTKSFNLRAVRHRLRARGTRRIYDLRRKLWGYGEHAWLMLDDIRGRLRLERFVRRNDWRLDYIAPERFGVFGMVRGQRFDVVFDRGLLRSERYFVCDTVAWHNTIHGHAALGLSLRC